ncbi:MAG: hypothetical protein JWR50_2607 [Mucilaginibacter sp.]|nr:hypothetical protein [Mucilaginibacter sp.]
MSLTTANLLIYELYVKHFINYALLIPAIDLFLNILHPNSISPSNPTHNTLY